MTLAIQRQPGANTVAVVDAVKAKLPVAPGAAPGALKLDVLFDRSVPIRESVDDVKFTLVLTIALVVLVIFLFLRNVRRRSSRASRVPAVDRRHVRRDVRCWTSRSTTCRSWR